MSRFSKATVLLVVMTFVFLGCSSDTKTLKTTPSSVKFGDINIGDTVTQDIVLKNKYGKDIVIDSMALVGGSDFIILSGNAVPISLAKDAEHTVTIQFEPTSIGDMESVLSITSDAATKAKEITITGTGIPVPRIRIIPDPYDFQKLLINKTHNKDFEIENYGTSALDVSAINFAGTGAAIYSVTGGNAPVQIAPGTKHTFTVTVSPTVIGTFDVDMQIAHNAVNGTNPAVVALKAEAIDVDPQITLNQGNPWDFGSVAKTLPGVQICEIKNTGIDPLTVTSATLTTGAEFTVDSLKDSNGNVINFPQTIAVGAAIYLGILFSPTANTTYNDTLTFVHDGTNESNPWDVALTGLGRDELTKTFSYTGAAEQWVVPAGVSKIKVECYGGEGGSSYPFNAGHLKGKGGKAEAKVPVTPGDTIYVYVAGKGGDAASYTGGTGGFNGGGTGGNYNSYAGGGGGGASDIRVGGNALADRKIVGAGGGGAGYDYSSGDNGGNGGGLTGQNGAANSNYTHLKGGKGGTQTAGGAEGGPYSSYGSGYPGALGTGGNGGNGGSGAGGAGYYGGGGSIWAGGGGGSSYYDAAGNTDKSTTDGVRSGNGEIVITY